MPRYNVRYWVSGWGDHHSNDFEPDGAAGDMIVEADSVEEAKRCIIDQDRRRTIIKIEPCKEKSLR